MKTGANRRASSYAAAGCGVESPKSNTCCSTDCSLRWLISIRVGDREYCQLLRHAGPSLLKAFPGNGQDCSRRCLVVAHQRQLSLASGYVVWKQRFRWNALEHASCSGSRTPIVFTPPSEPLKEVPPN
ncbi:hypothetical protein AVEN_258626-1 [Araneus ventricosus]|uniref:Uncharacterized protein n=1 Tax=Araneus ventricosus TaxID=182803 RepID=A0A4Y2HN22_ARAVE|nr:hypothetical protein AVEN_258626-1 [Araneus ventricosus]